MIMPCARSLIVARDAIGVHCNCSTRHNFQSRGTMVGLMIATAVQSIGAGLEVDVELERFAPGAGCTVTTSPDHEARQRLPGRAL